MLAGVVRIATQIGLTVVAEGVETAQELAAARATGCRVVQGFLLARPLLPEQVA